MEDVIVQNTHSSPSIKFLNSGELILLGVSCFENSEFFYRPLISFASQLKVSHVNLFMQLEFIDSVSSKYLSEIVKSLEANSNIQALKVNWFYDSEDLNMRELGETFMDNAQKAKYEFFVCVSESMEF